MNYKVGDKFAIIDGIKMFTNNEENHYKIWIKEEDIQSEPPMTAEEAWEIAKKILLYPEYGGYNSLELEEIFGRTEHLWEMTPQQAKSKIEAWEEKIEIGDFVEFEDKIFCVTRILGDYYCGIDKNGSVYSTKKKCLKKTGRRIDIESLLQLLKGEKDD